MDEVVQDLKDRLARTHLPPDIGHGDWAHGTRRQYLGELLDYWRDEFDWSQQERGLSRFKHYTVDIRGHKIHFVRAVAGDGAMPLILTHGWPSSFYELTHLIEPLGDVRAGGGYDLVIPSLPGFGFSVAATKPWQMPTIHELWKTLMVDVLGHTRFGAHGGNSGRNRREKGEI